jgi:hypothetical protein
MAQARRFSARLGRPEVLRSAEACGLLIPFEPFGRRAPEEAIEDLLDLGPELTLSSAAGLAKLLRVLRAARRSASEPATRWLGRPEQAARALESAQGTPLALEVVPRTQLRFTAWLEEETLSVDHVVEVLENESSLLIRRLGLRAPVRVSRREVVRHETSQQSWFEVLSVERVV